MRKLFMTALLVTAVAASVKAVVVPTDRKTRLTDNWMFLQSDIGNIWEAVRPRQKEDVPVWRPVALPHCFNATDAVDPDANYYQGPGWYKTALEVANPYPSGRILLEFEGTGQRTDVYVYLTKIATHTGGYDGWFVDITDAAAAFLEGPDAERFGGRVPVSVRCDNSRNAETIPSDLSDFNLYGGLYRPVNLIYVPALSFGNVRTDARLDEDGRGTLDIRASFYDPAGYDGAAKATVRVTDPEGREVVLRETELRQPADEVTLATANLKKPFLWDDRQPDLYTCEITLKSDDGELTTTHRFGFRRCEFAEHGPFMLNGRRVLLKGTHRHEDHAGVGAALTDETIRREMQMIKDMGANFIRLGHYQQSDLVLDLCDELGILVWEEVPWCRGGLGGEAYRRQGCDMLTNMIRQHRNHPSIIVWGMGNENDWPGDFPEFDKETIREYMRTLHTLSHRLDDTRPTAIRRCDFCKDIVDIYSPSVWPGWYKGRYTDYKNVTYNEIMNTPRYLHVEWGGDSHARRYSENPYRNIDTVDTAAPFITDTDRKPPYTGRIGVPGKGDWSESYICDLFDWVLKEQETMPWLTGAANWTFKDFSTPLRPENPIPYVNQKGLAERDLTPKESYFVFQSYWSDRPMAHIFGREWVRNGNPGEPRQIRVYSNCDEVELFVNGRSQGIKRRDPQNFPAAGLRWECLLNEGPNEVRAVGRKGKGKTETTATDELTVEYQSRKWNRPARIEAEVYPETNGVLRVEAFVKDDEGVRCLDAANRIEFEYAGDGEMICNLGTSTGSRKIEAYNGRAVIRIRQPEGTGTLAIKSEGLSTCILPL